MRNRSFGVLVLLMALAGAHAQTTPHTAKEITLYSFTGGSDGYSPLAGLVFDAKGNLYGTTYFGSSISNLCRVGCGTVFQLTPEANGSWSFATIHSLAGPPNDYGHAATRLTFDSEGNLFGTAATGGPGACGLGCGGIFELSPSNGWSETLVYSFTTATGDWPSAALTFHNGAMYGSTQFGPESRNGSGTLFSLTQDSSGQWQHSILHAFRNGKDGYEPQTDLVFDQQGHIYGSTPYGGVNASGDIFELEQTTSGRWGEKIIYTFPFYGLGVSYYPSALIADSAGNLYGTTSAGGSGCGVYGCGTVFELKKTGTGWEEITLYEFAGGTDGFGPYGGLIADALGNMYGTTNDGGTGNCQMDGDSGCGTVFKLALVNGTWQKSTLYNFSGGADGEYPDGALVMDAAGNLYGATSGGFANGTTGFGSIYEIQP